MKLIYDELAYDLHVTVGRGQGEMYLFEVGYWLGVLGAYLDDAFMAEQQWEAAESDWYHQPLFEQAIDEGKSNRHEHTGEDLFIWAHDWLAGRTWPGATH